MLRLVVCSSDVVVVAVATVGGRGVWPSGRGRGIVSECITIAFLTVLGLCHRVRPVHGSASIAGVVAWSNRTSACGRHLSIPGVVDLLVASPERFAASTRCVVVGWRRAVALLFLVVSDEDDLEGGRDEEEEGVDDRDGEDGCLELAGTAQVGCVCDTVIAAKAETICAVAWGVRVRWPATKDSVDVARARPSSTAIVPSNCDVAADEADVKDHGDEGEEHDAAEEDCEDHCEE